MVMRHGLTLGEMGHWFLRHFGLAVAYRVIEMTGWRPDAGPGFGWPPERAWIHPSPPPANINLARAHARTARAERAKPRRGGGEPRTPDTYAANAQRAQAD